MDYDRFPAWLEQPDWATITKDRMELLPPAWLLY